MNPAALASPLLVLAPHPDDDVLGCSRLMQRVAQRGGEVVIAWLTDGGASHGALSAPDRAALAGRRRAEALGGVKALGVVPQAVYFLGHPDGALAAHMADAGAAVAAICERHRVRTAVVTDTHDRHPDHRAAYAIAMGLSLPRVLSYPISARYDGAGYAPPATAVALGGDPDDGKRAALLCHASQMEPAAMFPLTRATVERFCAEPEYFLPARIAADAG